MKSAKRHLRHGSRTLHRLSLLVSGAILLGVATAEDPGYEADGSVWWEPGSGELFPDVQEFTNSAGTLRILVEDGPVETSGHPFFEPLGPNGRACVTCHQPADGMSISPATARARWDATAGTDPLFAAIDGSNCPSLPQDERESHSLLLEHGLFRIVRPWPPRDLQGNPVETDFTIEVVRDPWGCNTGDRYGLEADEPSVSVYRRPRPVANLKYILAIGFPYDPKSGQAMRVDPETGKPVSGNLMSDARAETLNWQMRDAAVTHLEMLRELDEQELEQIADFESRVFAAQQTIAGRGSLDAGGAEGGPALLQKSEAGLLGIFSTPVWSEFDAWAELTDEEKAQLPPDTLAYRESVARGLVLWRTRSFLVSDSAGINQPLGFGNPVRNTCQFCHNMSRTGIDVAPGQIDLGTSNQPFADPLPHLPLFRITCTGKPHPHYGRQIMTTDPGYALTTGRCADVGKITTQQMRALAAREPLFHNGSAKDVAALVDYYDRRYNIGYTEQERQDMINLMNAL